MSTRRHHGGGHAPLRRESARIPLRALPGSGRLDDFGFDDVYGEPAPYVYDLADDPYARRDFPDAFRDPFTRFDTWLLRGCAVALIFVVFAALAGWLS